MRSNIFSISVLCFALGPLALMAQQPVPPPLPQGPLILKHAPDFAKWTVTLKYGSLEGEAAPGSTAPTGTTSPKPIPPVVTTFTKTGQILHVEITKQNQVLNVWNIGTMKLMVDASGKGCSPIYSSTRDFKNEFDVDLSQSDFPGFQWISSANYSGIKSFMGKKCIVFKSPVQGAAASAPSSSPTLIAYIDLDSRLPVALQNDDVECLYQFLAAPTDTQVPPPPVQTFLKERQQAAARAAHVSLPAY